MNKTRSSGERKLQVKFYDKWETVTHLEGGKIGEPMTGFRVESGSGYSSRSISDIRIIGGGHDKT